MIRFGLIGLSICIGIFILSCEPNSVFIESNIENTVSRDLSSNPYTIYYDVNGATSGLSFYDNSFSPSYNRIVDGVLEVGAIIKFNNLPKKAGYNFVGWMTEKDGSGTSYFQENIIHIKKNISVYAIWVPDNLIVENLGGYIAITGYTTLTTEKLVIPAGVEAIFPNPIDDHYAFNNCDILTELDIPKSLKLIEKTAFQNCKSLAKIIVRGPTLITGWSFYGCQNLNSVTFLSQDAKVEGLSFGLCKSLKNINLPLNSKYVNGFYGSGLESIVIPDAITEIGYQAFYSCKNLKTVKIGKSVEKIQAEAFTGTSISSVSLPPAVRSIGKNAFNNCIFLSEMNINSGLKDIAEAAFQKTALKSLVIPESLSAIGKKAFEGCVSLNTLIINSKSIEIGESAFANCDKLCSFKLNSLDCVIKSNAFENDVLLSNVDFGNAVLSIGDYSFSNCSSLDNLVFPKSTNSIGEFAFYDCGKLSYIYIPGSIKRINIFSFKSCSKLQSVVVGNGITDIGDGAFDGCLSLVSLRLPYSLKKISKNSICNTGLKAICLPPEISVVSEFYLDNLIVYLVSDIPPPTTFTASSALYEKNIYYVPADPVIANRYLNLYIGVVYPGWDIPILKNRIKPIVSLTEKNAIIAAMKAY